MHMEVRLEAQRHHVKADPARMQQVFWNLLANARKFTAAGGRIAVRSRNTDNGDGSVIVEVSDTGVGIDPELLPKLFNAFEQGEAARVAPGAGGGLGLGLAISRALVLAHGGSLSASSAGKDQGATFTITLPTVAAIDQPRRDNIDGQRALPPLSILLVEDDEASLTVLQRLLEMRHHRVTPAATFADALRAAEGQKFDLLISDLALPDGDGCALMREIRARFGTKGIALTGFGMDQDIRRSLDSGFSEHLIKPVDLETLDSAMRQLFANGAPTPTAAAYARP